MTTRARSYSLRQVMDLAVDSRLRDVHVACPARVLAYDGAKQKADVQPLVQVIYLDEAGERQAASLPVIVDVPVLFPGAGGYRITFPIKAGDVDGDTMLLVFSEASLDRWLDQGGGPLDPQDDRRFHISDAIAIPGLRDFAHALASAPADRMTIGKDDSLQMHIDGTSIRIGDNDAPNLDTAGLGGAIATALANINSWLTTHTHPVSGSTAGPANESGPTIPNVQSSKVKVAK